MEKGKEEIVYETCDSGSSDPSIAVPCPARSTRASCDMGLDLGPRAGHHQGFR